MLSCCWADAFFAPTAFSGQQLAGVSAPSHTSGVTMKIFDWKRRQEPDGVGEGSRARTNGEKLNLKTRPKINEQTSRTINIRVFGKN